MSNTRLITTNRAIGATVRNGGAAGSQGAAPALVQTSPYTMAQSLTRDRYTIWQATPGASFAFDFDLGADYSVDSFGLLRLQYVGSTALTNITGHYTTSGTGYAGGALSATPPGWSNFAAALTIPAPPMTRRDFVLALASPVTGRYFRFDFNFSVAGQFSVGKLMLGLRTDLGVLYSPTTAWTVTRPQLIAATPTGEDVIFDLSRKVWEFNGQFKSIQQSLRDTLLSLTDLPGTFAMLDTEDNALEMRLKDSGISWTHDFVGIYSATMNAVSLP